MANLLQSGSKLLSSGKGLIDKATGANAKSESQKAIGSDEMAKQYLFKLTAEGLDTAQFAKVSGYSSELEIDYVKEGGINDFSHPFVKGAKHSQVTLEKGMTKNDVLWKWYEEALNGKIERKDITIELLNKNKKGPLFSWTFKRAFPVKWEGTEFDAMGAGLVFEKIVIEHEGMVRAVPPPPSGMGKLKSGFAGAKSGFLLAKREAEKLARKQKRAKAKRERDEKLKDRKKAQDARKAKLAELKKKKEEAEKLSLARKLLQEKAKLEREAKRLEMEAEDLKAARNNNEANNEETAPQ